MNTKNEARIAEFWVEWPGGRVTRPVMAGTFDLTSGRVLSWDIAPKKKELAE